MTRKRWLIAWGLIFGLIFLPAGRAFARPSAETAIPAPSATVTPTPFPQSDPQTDDGIEMGEAMGRYAQQLALSAGVGTAYVATNTLWFITRFLLAILEIVLDGQWSTNLVDITLRQLQATMPQILQSILLGQNGLLYLALVVVGLTMVFPFLMRGSPVRIDRVFIWAALILGLFAGSEAAGYNIISLFEHTRVVMLETILGLGEHDTPGVLQSLILEPWRATQADARLVLEFRLPQAFQEAFFPEPVEDNVRVNIARAWWQSTWKLETPESLERRRDGAFQALFWAGIGIYGVVVLGFVAFASAALALASLLLIVLFLSTLPLALFSFGEVLVLRVLHRWIAVVAATLFLGIFLRLTTGWMDALSLAGGEIAAVITWFVWMTLMLIAFVKFAHLALELFTSSLLLVGAITSTAVGNAQFADVRGSSRIAGRKTAHTALTAAGLVAGVAGGSIGAVLSRPGVTFGIAAATALTGGLPTAAPVGAVVGEGLYQSSRWMGGKVYKAGPWALKRSYRALRGNANVFMARTGI